MQSAACLSQLLSTTTHLCCPLLLGLPQAYACQQGLSAWLLLLQVVAVLLLSWRPSLLLLALLLCQQLPLLPAGSAGESAGPQPQPAASSTSVYQF
jgi:hypothetical protein